MKYQIHNILNTLNFATNNPTLKNVSVTNWGTFTRIRDILILQRSNMIYGLEYKTDDRLYFGEKTKVTEEGDTAKFAKHATGCDNVRVTDLSNKTYNRILLVSFYIRRNIKSIINYKID